MSLVYYIVEEVVGRPEYDGGRLCGIEDPDGIYAQSSHSRGQHILPLGSGGSRTWDRLPSATRIIS